ncbi:MAG: hypothetical protein WDN06_06745 [Asticcacaulis sp.]
MAALEPEIPENMGVKPTQGKVLPAQSFLLRTKYPCAPKGRTIVAVAACLKVKMPYF